MGRITFSRTSLIIRKFSSARELKGTAPSIICVSRSSHLGTASISPDYWLLSL